MRWDRYGRFRRAVPTPSEAPLLLETPTTSFAWFPLGGRQTDGFVKLTVVANRAILTRTLLGPICSPVLCKGGDQFSVHTFQESCTGGLSSGFGPWMLNVPVIVADLSLNSLPRFHFATCSSRKTSRCVDRHAPGATARTKKGFVLFYPGVEKKTQEKKIATEPRRVNREIRVDNASPKHNTATNANSPARKSATIDPPPPVLYLHRLVEETCA